MLTIIRMSSMRTHVALVMFEDFRMLTNYKDKFDENSCCFGDI
jgi:hypothetical protein